MDNQLVRYASGEAAIPWRDRQMTDDLGHAGGLRGHRAPEGREHEARIRMEEAAGRRRRGERRIQDGLRGSWRDW